MLPLWGWIVILWLSAPIIVMIVFGFNSGNTTRQVSNSFKGITFKWYANLFAVSDLTSALWTSITIALLTTLISVALGTLMGVALGRWKFRGAGSVNLLLFANIAAPEVVLGAALLSLFLTLNIPLGYLTILLAHVMFSLAYVVVTVRARMAGMDPSLEEAARDLGAGPFITFFRVTLPVIAPGVFAGGLLAFALSIDDYIITSFNNGNTRRSRCGSGALTSATRAAFRRRSTSWARSSSPSACWPRWSVRCSPGRRHDPRTSHCSRRARRRKPVLLLARLARSTGARTAAARTHERRPRRRRCRVHRACGRRCSRRRPIPARDVVLLDARSAGWAASGRNGGFCVASLTHGIANGIDRFPDEMAVLDRLGRANLDAIEATVQRYGIDCGFERTGELSVAVEPHQVDWLREDVTAAVEFGHDAVFLDQDAMRAEVNVADLPRRCVGSQPRRPRRPGSARVGAARGVPPARRADLRGHRGRDACSVTVPPCSCGAERTPRFVLRSVALATNAFPAPVRRLRQYVVPVWDYVLMTEPLSDAQLDSIGWRNRQGLGDSANQFHYFRLTHDNRILWGGYDAIYYWRSGLRDELDQRPETFNMLAQQFFETFPQLDGLRFTHRWGGAIDTSTRFFAFQGTALGGRVAYSLGYTGLGVGATRFGASVMLDLLDGRSSEALSLRAIRSKPLPFPPEPLRWAGIQLTRRALARADRNSGRRGPWLRTLDRLGLGFDS